jgi:lysozyme
MKNIHKAGIGVATAGAIALALPYIKQFEGYWPTVKIDWIGTGHPPTGGYGETENVRLGETHNEAFWSDRLKMRLPQYFAKIAPCIHVELPDSAEAALISAAYNAGPAAVCRSPMLARMNAGNIRGGCEAFRGWYIMASGRVIQGLINRRNQERALCLSGLDKSKPDEAKPEASKPVVAHYHKKIRPPKAEANWWTSWVFR